MMPLVAGATRPHKDSATTDNEVRPISRRTSGLERSISSAKERSKRAVGGAVVGTKKKRSKIFMCDVCTRAPQLSDITYLSAQSTSSTEPLNRCRKLLHCR